MQIVAVSPNINNSQNVTFKSAPIKSNFFKPFKDTMFPVTTRYNGFMDKTTDKIAEKLVKILEKPFAEKIINKIKDSDIISHLTVLTSFVLAGFYIKKTLENDKLDEKNRKTLAINQAFVTVLSAGLGYMTNGLLDEKINAFTDKFMTLNANEPPAQLEKYQKGISTASKIMVFMTIYRFIAPVLVTPFANYIGHKLHENEQKNKISEAK